MERTSFSRFHPLHFPRGSMLLRGRRIRNTVIQRPIVGGLRVAPPVFSPVVPNSQNISFSNQWNDFLLQSLNTPYSVGSRVDFEQRYPPKHIVNHNWDILLPSSPETACYTDHPIMEEPSSLSHLKEVSSALNTSMKCVTDIPVISKVMTTCPYSTPSESVSNVSFSSSTSKNVSKVVNNFLPPPEFVCAMALSSSSRSNLEKETSAPFSSSRIPTTIVEGYSCEDSYLIKENDHPTFSGISNNLTSTNLIQPSGHIIQPYQELNEDLPLSLPSLGSPISQPYQNQKNTLSPLRSPSSPIIQPYQDSSNDLTPTSLSMESPISQNINASFSYLSSLSTPISQPSQSLNATLSSPLTSDDTPLHQTHIKGEPTSSPTFFSSSHISTTQTQQHMIRSSTSSIKTEPTVHLELSNKPSSTPPDRNLKVKKDSPMPIREDYDKAELLGLCPYYCMRSRLKEEERGPLRLSQLEKKIGKSKSTSSQSNAPVISSTSHNSTAVECMDVSHSMTMTSTHYISSEALSPLMTEVKKENITAISRSESDIRNENILSQPEITFSLPTSPSYTEKKEITSTSTIVLVSSLEPTKEYLCVKHLIEDYGQGNVLKSSCSNGKVLVNFRSEKAASAFVTKYSGYSFGNLPIQISLF